MLLDDEGIFYHQFYFKYLEFYRDEEIKLIRELNPRYNKQIL